MIVIMKGKNILSMLVGAEVDEVHHMSEKDIAENNGESFSKHKAFFKLRSQQVEELR